MKKLIFTLMAAIVFYMPSAQAFNQNSYNNLINPLECKIPILHKDPRYMPAFGTIDGLIISMDFINAKSDVDPISNSKDYTDNFVKYMNEYSYKKVNLNIDVLPKWYSLPKETNYYANNIQEYVQSTINYVDNDVDFSKYKIFYIVIPDQTPGFIMSGGVFSDGASEDTYRSQEGVVKNIVVSAAPHMQMGGSKWKFMAHETMHIFGVEHPHDYEGNLVTNMSIFSLMDAGFVSPGLYATERWKAGWITDKQIRCISSENKTTTYHKINSIEGIDLRGKAGIVKISDTEILVFESRRSEKFDVMPKEYEGLAVYVHNNQYVKPVLKDNFIIDKSKPEYNGFRVVNTIRQGESVTYKNITITNIKMSKKSDFVKVEIKS